MLRPHPPEDLISSQVEVELFIPSPQLQEWAMDTFIASGAPLENEVHRHLQGATIGFLWSGMGNSRHGNVVVGQAELMPPPVMGRWAKARAVQQLVEWFGDVPDFLITLDARYADQCSDATFCSLVEHELGHCGQSKDKYGMPAFTKDGRPKLAIRGHDLEEFVFIARRYGVGSAAGAARAFVEAANQRPLIAEADIAHACGTCLLKAA